MLRITSLAKVTAKADRLSQLRQVGVQQQMLTEGQEKRAQVIHYQVVDID
jgi:hypothetical protein